MFRNYLLSAFRNAIRQKLYTFIIPAELALVIAMQTVLLHSGLVVRARPVAVLRYE